MNRTELIDNLLASAERGETVTLTLRAVSGVGGSADRVAKTGRVVVPYAVHYTGRRSDQCVFLEHDQHVPLVIGLGMITNFRVGR